jgi:hypothetical protein
MIHPSTEVRWISSEKGYGVFATALIPKGTISYVKDELDLVFTRDHPLVQDERYRAIVDRYSYVDGSGNFILSWDHAKYVNHCCFPNTLSTGYGFEIAIRDIQVGDEITDDYGVFTVEHEMEMGCTRRGCRRIVRHEDFDKLTDQWDRGIISALSSYGAVAQPLATFLDTTIVRQLHSYLDEGGEYISVAIQKPRMGPQPAIRVRMDHVVMQ